MNARCSKRQCTFEHHETFYENVNIHIYTTHSSTSQLFVLSKMQRKAFSRVGVKIWDEKMNEKFCQRNPSIKKQSELFYSKD